MAHSEHLSPEQAKKENIRRIWTVAGYMGLITALEFMLAFFYPANISRVVIFILLTLLKAFFIVADFMHLRHEVRTLILSIMIPTAFVVWLIIALLVEGGAVFQARY